MNDLATAFDALTELVSMQGTDYKLIKVNQAYADALKMKPEDLIGRHCYEVMHGTTGPLSDCPHAEVLKTKKSVMREIFEPRLGFYLEVSVAPVFSANGELAGTVHIAKDITWRKCHENRLAKISECFLKQGGNTTENISLFTALCGELLGGVCALYNRLEGDLLCSLGQWEVPPDYNPKDTAAGHICYDVIQRNPEGVLVIRNLASSTYARTDPNVGRYGLQTYVGKTVKCGGQPIGSLCVVYQKDFCPTDEDKRIMNIIASAIGVEEERRKTSLTLQANEQKYRALVETTSDWIWEVDRNGIYTYASPQVKPLLGYAPEEVLGKTPFNLMPQDEAQRMGSLFAAIVADGKPFANLENINLHKNGRRVVLETSGIPIFDDQGHLRGYRGVDRDITERKRVEEALRVSERNLAMTLKSIGDAVIATDIGGGVVRMNVVAERLTGWPLSEAQGRPLTDVFHIINQQTREPLDNPVAKVLETGQVQGLANDTVLVSRQGVERIIADSAAAIVDDETGQTAGVVLVFRDVTEVYAAQQERKRVEEEIRKLNETLEQRVQERTAELEAFAYSISHDLRAPLRAIDSFARIMRENHGSHVGSEGQHYLQVIQDNCRQMDRLIEGLLTFSRLSQQPLNKQKVDVHDLVNSVLKDFNAERKERCVKIILGNLPSCEADPVLLRQVFFNLLSNALKFTRQKKEAFIEIGSREESRCVYFVKDNGVGFDMRYVHKLFNVFSRLHRAEDYEGAGVGLAIIHRIILRHGGRVWIEAEVNKGTTVCFTLA